MKLSLPERIAYQILKDYKHDEYIQSFQQLPTQQELQNKYYISRTTVVKALNILKDQGEIYSVQGKGIFFTEDKFSLYLNGVYSYDYKLSKLGVEIENILLSMSVIKADKHLASIFDCNSEDNIFEIIRKKVDKDSGEDLILQRNYLCYKRFDGLDQLDLNNQRLYVVLSKYYDLNLTSARELIKMEMLPPEISRYVDVKNDNKLRIDRYGYEYEKLIEYTNTYLLTNNFAYDIKLDLNEPII